MKPLKTLIDCRVEMDVPGKMGVQILLVPQTLAELEPEFYQKPEGRLRASCLDTNDVAVHFLMRARV
jgi:hypothetical protein